MKRSIYRLPSITLLIILIEFAIIIVASVAFTSQFLDPDPDLKFQGHEGEYLTSSAYFASLSLQEYGYIPLWQPYLAHGEPLLDNPFSMVLNPINTVPTLLVGANLGIRYSIVLTAIVAGIGGWALGRMMGFGSLGRIMLGLLMAGKGNMVGLISEGYLQLGGSQAYMPWVMAGTIGVLRMKHRRFPLVLTAVMYTLMFWAGNIYFLLPTAVLIAGLAITHLVVLRREDQRIWFQIDRVALGRLVLTGLLTLGLSAITFFPIFLQQEHIAHPDETGAGTYADLEGVIYMFFDGSRENYTEHLVPGGPEFYQSYILPLWFGLLMFIFLPPVGRRLYRPSMPEGWKIWSVGLVMIVFFTLWGSGQNPVVAWLYENAPLVGQWRFVGRMLGVATFWVAVLTVMRVDGLWRAVVLEHAWQTLPVIRRIPSIQAVCAALIAGVSLTAAVQVIAQWQDYAGPTPRDIYHEDECIRWLRAQNPDKVLSVWTLDYGQISVYLENRVRHARIAAAYDPVPMDSSRYYWDLARLAPEYAIPWSDGERASLREQGYLPVLNSPIPGEYDHCLWQKRDAHAYAFSVPVSILQDADDRGTLPADVTNPITNFVQYPDQIGLGVTALADEPLAVMVQEVAYPGWTVSVDGHPAQIESIGGLISVVLPPGNEQHLIHFAYRPPLLYAGGVTTLIAWVICILYLLHLDRFIPSGWKTRGLSVMRRTGKNVYTALTSPELFEPRLPPEEPPLLPSPEDDSKELEEVKVPAVAVPEHSNGATEEQTGEG